MGSLIVSLLPFIIGSTAVPIQIIINILLLQNPQQGLLKSAAYVCGMTLLRLLQGLVFILILSRSTVDSAEGNSGKGPVVSTLLLVLSIFLLITAYKKWQKEDDPDSPPPQWLTAIANLSPLKAFAIGFGMLAIGPKFWVFTLSAVGTITEAKLGLLASVVAYLLFVLLAQISVLLPLFIRIIMPKRSQSMLQKFSTWLTHYERVIIITVSLIFGLFFLYQGLKGLLQ
jgi:threonine/homoserine/homoserine lactone efflux protein